MYILTKFICWFQAPIRITNNEYLFQSRLRYYGCRNYLSLWWYFHRLDPYSIYFSDTNLFSVDYVWCKLCNKWLLLFENNSSSLILEVKDRVIDDNLKRQIKNRTLCMSQLFLLTWLLQYISNWSKAFQLVTTLFCQYT